MSDTMLHGILNMPIDLLDTRSDFIQYHARGVEASKRIKDLELIINELIEVGNSNTGNEPSLSCWARTCYKAREFIESTK